MFGKVFRSVHFGIACVWVGYMEVSVGRRSVTHALHIPQAGVQPGLGGTIEAGGELLVWLNTTLSHRRALHQAS